MARVTILMGSNSDEATVAPCMEVLQKLGIDFFVTVTSAHRSGDRTQAIIREQEAAGTEVFICAAGMAAHLAGVVASRTIRPVIGIPIKGGALMGMDALLSTVQMPSGFPVATVALDGARNAAWLAAQILALHDHDLAEKIHAERKRMCTQVEEAGRAITEKYLEKYGQEGIFII